MQMETVAKLTGIRSECVQLIQKHHPRSPHPGESVFLLVLLYLAMSDGDQQTNSCRRVQEISQSRIIDMRWKCFLSMSGNADPRGCYWQEI